MGKKKKNKVFFVHGGETFSNKDVFYKFLRNRTIELDAEKKSWKNWLAEELDEDFDALMPRMPNSMWADYEAWKIWFEKYFQFLNEGKLVFIGHSLGGIFLAKYLSENTFPRKIEQLHLVSPVIDNGGLPDGSELGNFLFDIDKLSKLDEQIKHIYLYHSKDDSVVPYSHSERYHESMPNSELITFEDRGHFLGEDFPDLLKNIYKLY